MTSRRLLRLAEPLGMPAAAPLFPMRLYQQQPQHQQAVRLFCVFVFVKSVSLSKSLLSGLASEKISLVQKGTLDLNRHKIKHFSIRYNELSSSGDGYAGVQCTGTPTVHMIRCEFQYLRMNPKKVTIGLTCLLTEVGLLTSRRQRH